MSLKTRISWMLSGPTRLDEMERSIAALQQQLATLQLAQDDRLAEVRSSVAVVLDDVTARMAALDHASRTADPAP